MYMYGGEGMGDIWCRHGGGDIWGRHGGGGHMVQAWGGGTYGAGMGGGLMVQVWGDISTLVRTCTWPPHHTHMYTKFIPQVQCMGKCVAV